ncbi:ISAs1 family transposase [Streptomyces mirabilis]
MLLICACAVVSGARAITEITEWGQRATTTVLELLGIRRHLPGRRRAPSQATLTRLLAALDGDALDAAIGAYPAERDHTDAGGTSSAPRTAIAVDGKALSGSAHRRQRHRHLLSAVTHAPTVTLARREEGARTNETAAFRPLLEPLDLTDAVVTFDALHSVKDQVRWLVQEKKAHSIAVIKGNQPTASARVKTLPWEQVPVAHTVSGTGHGRRESRSIKTMAIAANLGGIAFPEARLALRIHRRRQESGKRQTQGTVYAVTSLDTHQASPADGRSAEPGHRQATTAGSPQHRQGHPSDPGRTRTRRLDLRYHWQPAPAGNLKPRWWTAGRCAAPEPVVIAVLRKTSSAIAEHERFGRLRGRWCRPRNLRHANAYWFLPRQSTTSARPVSVYQATTPGTLLHWSPLPVSSRRTL